MDIKQRTIYQVFVSDEWDNWWYVGEFNSLSDAEPQVNNFLSTYELYVDDSEVDDPDVPKGVPQFGEGGNLGPLTEYPSTFGPCFDRVIPVDSGSLHVGGFIKTQVDLADLFEQVANEASNQAVAKALLWAARLTKAAEEGILLSEEVEQPPQGL